MKQIILDRELPCEHCDGLPKHKIKLIGDYDSTEGSRMVFIKKCLTCEAEDVETCSIEEWKLIFTNKHLGED